MNSADTGHEIAAPLLHFTEHVIRPDGKPGRRGHYFLWGRCGACGEAQLVRRPGLTKRRCAMTPRCRGLLTPTEVEDGGPVGLARMTFSAVVVEDITEGAA